MRFYAEICIFVQWWELSNSAAEIYDQKVEVSASCELSLPWPDRAQETEKNML